MARENMDNSMERFRLESENVPGQERQQTINKLLKIGVILILGFLLLNFVLVVIVMNRKSEISSSPSTEDFSAAMNQTHETAQIVDKMKVELNGIEKRMTLTEEKFEGHHFKIQSLLNQTKIDQQMEALENDNRELKKSREEFKEQFESLSKTIDQLKNNISSNHGVSFLPSPQENQNQGISAAAQSITSCSVAMEAVPSPRSKKQTIYPYGNNTSLEVLCDFETDGGGWTTIQKRSSGPKEEFYRNWTEYAKGFGSLDGNFWMGLDNIRALTQNRDQELRIELEDFAGEKTWAKYSHFSISDASNFYRLTISGFDQNSPAGDSMTGSVYSVNNAMGFTTKDKDHVGHRCVSNYGAAGWWFNGCGGSGLNGLYFMKGETVPHYKGIYWYSFKESVSHSLAKSEMKIRTRK